MSDLETIETYGAKAAEYAALPMTETQSRTLAGFMARLPAGGKVLDFGCGPGIHAAEMVRAGFEVEGIDATPAFVEAARAHGVNARLAEFDDLDAQGLYDGVWASFSLLHAPRSAFPRHLAALHRALRAGGILFLGMKLGEGEKRDALGRFYTFYSRDDLTRALTKAGFCILDIEEGAEKGLAGTTDPFALITAQVAANG